MKFKVGDRVAVYQDAERLTGVVDGVTNTGLVSVNGDNWNTLPRLLVHPKQCRRLIKKPRRRVWIHSTSIGELSTLRVDQEGVIAVRNHPPLPFTSAWVEFIEVKRK